MNATFEAAIYKLGINTCVDVPREITDQLQATRGQIKIIGTINGFAFKKTLMPVKNGPYRLFVNLDMLRGGGAAVGEKARFVLQPDLHAEEKTYPIPESLTQALTDKGLLSDFDQVSPSRKKEILKYLSYIKTEDTLEKNIAKLIEQLERKEKALRLP